MVESSALLKRRTPKGYPGFESLPHRVNRLVASPFENESSRSSFLHLRQRQSSRGRIDGACRGQSNGCNQGNWRRLRKGERRYAAKQLRRLEHTGVICRLLAGGTSFFLKARGVFNPSPKKTEATGTLSPPPNMRQERTATALQLQAWPSGDGEECESNQPQPSNRLSGKERSFPAPR